MRWSRSFRSGMFEYPSPGPSSLLTSARCRRNVRAASRPPLRGPQGGGNSSRITVDALSLRVVGRSVVDLRGHGAVGGCCVGPFFDVGSTPTWSPGQTATKSGLIKIGEVLRSVVSDRSGPTDAPNNWPVTGQLTAQVFAFAPQSRTSLRPSCRRLWTATADSGCATGRSGTGSDASHAPGADERPTEGSMTMLTIVVETLWQTYQA